jgi:hypothetical protein
MGLPWYLKSFFNQGTVFSIDLGVHAAVRHSLAATQWWEPLVHFFPTTILKVLESPWTFSLMPSQHRGDTIGPLLLMTFPFLFLIKKPKPYSFLLAIGVYLLEILALETLTGGTSVRYSFFILLFGIPLSLWIIENLRPYRKLHGALIIAVAVQIAMGAILFAKRYHHQWLALVTLESRERYYTEGLREYPIIALINNLPDSLTIMPVYNYFNYLIDKPYVTAYRSYSSCSDMMDDFKRKKIGYIFGNNPFDSLENRNALAGCLERTTIASAHGLYLFKVEMK